MPTSCAGAPRGAGGELRRASAAYARWGRGSHRHLHLDRAVRLVPLQLKVIKGERVDVSLGRVDSQAREGAWRVLELRVGGAGGQEGSGKVKARLLV